MRVKPAPGCAVRDPKTLIMLSDDGREVPDNDLFWVRRVRDGDVIVEEEHHARRGHHEPPPRKEA